MGDIQFAPPPMNAAHSAVISITAKIMVAAIITIFFVVVFCLFLMLCARWQWSDSEDPSIVSWRRRTARRRQAGAVAVRKRGLDRATLKSLPVLVYDPKDFKEGLECAVCLSEVSEGEKARLLPKCHHGFHVECIDMWFQSHSTCPLCRNPVISTKKSANDGNNNDVELEGNDRTVSDSDAESDLGSDSDYSNHSHDSAAHSGETAAFPTNVLFWADESQVRAHGEATNATAASTTASSSSNTGGRSQRDELVIEIPRDLCDDCEEEAKTPVVSRLRSLRRMLSRGKGVAPSTSGEVEAV